MWHDTLVLFMDNNVISNEINICKHSSNVIPSYSELHVLEQGTAYYV